MHIVVPILNNRQIIKLLQEYVVETSVRIICLAHRYIDQLFYK